MKKKLVAAFTSLLLVICACVSLVACGGRDPEGGDENSLAGNWIYEGDIKDKDQYLVMTEGGENSYSAVQYSIGSSETYSVENGKPKSSSYSFKRNEDGTYTGNLVVTSENEISIGTTKYTKTNKTLSEWSAEHNAYLTFLKSSWLSDGTVGKLQGYAQATELTTGVNKGQYELKLTYVDNLWGGYKTESHSLASLGLTSNTYKWGNYTLTLQNNSFTLTYEDESYSFVRTELTIEAWKGTLTAS